MGPIARATLEPAGESGHSANRRDLVGRFLSAPNVLFPASLHAKYNFYILVHVWIAACSTYAVAVAWRMQPASSCLSGLAYAYGAPMLFNYCNVIFLIVRPGFPSGFWPLIGCSAKRSTSAATALGVVAALMVLGGDPHTAYHLGLTAILGICCYSTVRKWKDGLCRGAIGSGGGDCRVLAAVVLLPGWEWGRDSVSKAIRPMVSA